MKTSYSQFKRRKDAETSNLSSFAGPNDMKQDMIVS